MSVASQKGFFSSRTSAGSRSSFSSRTSAGSRGFSGAVVFQAVGGGGPRMSVSTSSVRSSYTPSVYGGAGGYGTRISQSVSAFPMAVTSSEFVMGSNEKETMKNLNDRLASYLEKVRSLEAANMKIDLQIKEFCQKRTPDHNKDWTVYFDTITGLREKLLLGYMDRAMVVVQLENAKMAAEDFKIKYETELNMRMSVEAEIAGLRGILDSLTILRSTLEMEIEGLKEELIYLKKSHEEEMELKREQQCGAVIVDVDGGESFDLNKALEHMREQYEGIVQKNRTDVEKWFQGKVEALQVEIATSTTEVTTSKSEMSSQKTTYQSLEMDLQSMLSQKQCLEQSLADVNDRYGAQLSTLQLRINAMEQQVQHLTASIHHQSSEYQVLLDIKMRLEMEIAEYRRLLGGETDGVKQEVWRKEESSKYADNKEFNSSSSSSSSNQIVVTTSSQQNTVQQVEEKKVVVVKKVEEVKQVEEEHHHIQKRVKVIVEKIVDGKVVDTEFSEEVEELS